MCGIGDFANTDRMMYCKRLISLCLFCFCAYMDSIRNNKIFYQGKRVFVTGHTGFKGAWRTTILHELGAETCGYALAPEAGCLYEKIDGDSLVERNIIADVRDGERLARELCDFRPEIVMHLAALLPVQACFTDPRLAYETHVMGTVNLLEAVRKCGSVKSVLMVTTDKVYENKGDDVVYKETDPIGANDPYGSSKACMELVTADYRKTYLQTENRQTGISTARASNVVAGGDHIKSRLIPSILAGFAAGKPVELRHPEQTRPWQSVLDCLNGYLSIARLQYGEPETYSDAWNIGPTKEGIQSAGEVVAMMQRCYQTGGGYTVTNTFKAPESQSLGLDITKAISRLDWKPELTLEETIAALVDFFRREQSGENVQTICRNQIQEFFHV
jgi:CDP-glucose 4,6-dehydratase